MNEDTNPIEPNPSGPTYMERLGRVGLLKKINAVREDVMKLDWKDDAYADFRGKGGFKYLTTDKLMRNFNPLFAVHGIEVCVEYGMPEFKGEVGSLSQHVLMCADISLIDIDTGAEMRYKVWGEAADSGDKAVRKACTVAVRQWLLSNFLIADGVDEVYGAAKSGFVPRSAEEQEEARSAVLALGEKPADPDAMEARKRALAEKRAARKAEKEKPAEAPSEPAEEAKAEEKAPAPSEPERPAGPKAGGRTGKAYIETLPKAERNIVDMIVEKRTALHKTGEMDEESFERMQAQLDMMEGASDLKTFKRIWGAGL